mmetsp:Transcript_26585/g.77647  ORF Transcript_26585/g.77647 Transcript_26585/m.77647 type:complete len:240 (+) Transcript_26585:964-1683(+)
MARRDRLERGEVLLVERRHARAVQLGELVQLLRQLQQVHRLEGLRRVLLVLDHPREQHAPAVLGREHAVERGVVGRAVALRRHGHRLEVPVAAPDEVVDLEAADPKLLPLVLRELGRAPQRLCQLLVGQLLAVRLPHAHVLPFQPGRRVAARAVRPLRLLVLVLLRRVDALALDEHHVLELRRRAQLHELGHLRLARLRWHGQHRCRRAGLRAGLGQPEKVEQVGGDLVLLLDAAVHLE